MPNPNPAHNPTDGLKSVAFVQVSGTGVVAGKTVAAGKPNPANYALTLSLSAAGGHAATCQLTPALVDVNNVAFPSSFTLTAVANASGATSVYTGTITGGAANAFAGFEFTVTGFATAANNGTFLCTASGATTLTLTNSAGVAETHAGAAASYVGTVVYYSYADPANKAGSPPAWYNPSNLSGYDPNVASVSSSGLITSRAVGVAIVEVSFPTFDNTLGSATQAQKEPIMNVYTQIVVTVIP